MAGSDSGVRGMVLVVDDDRSARLLLERLLSRAGHTVTLVETAELGLEKLETQDFDLIITDQNMPGLDGLEVLRRARAKHPATQGILMTGFPNAETRDAAATMGIFSYVTKPFGVHDILGQCEGAIRKAQGLDA